MPQRMKLLKGRIREKITEQLLKIVVNIFELQLMYLCTSEPHGVCSSVQGSEQTQRSIHPSNPTQGNL